MNMKKIIIICAVIVSFLGLTHDNAHGVLPADFPGLTTTYDPAKVAEGSLFLAVYTQTPGIGQYLMILENDGTPVWYLKVDTLKIYDFKPLPNGFIHYAPFLEKLTFAGGGTVTHEILDASYNPRESIQAGNAFLAESHDFQLLPNGHVLLMGYYITEVDMSKQVPGGYPNAVVAGTVLQELDTQRNVVFQWKSWDYETFEHHFSTLQDDSRVKKFAVNAHHVNVMDLDTDGHILVQTPQPGGNLDATSGYIKKINRQTGEVMWQIGGRDNQFTFVGVSEADGMQAFSGHNFNRLPNGNVLMYDNGARDFTRPSRAWEFELDEFNKVATYVWDYAPTEMTVGFQCGSAQRQENGNTLIGWGGLRQIPACTEVTPDGQVAFELVFDNARVGSYRAFRSVWPPNEGDTVQLTELSTGNTYDFNETGVTIDVIDLTNNASNEVTVTREPYAPVFPEFSGKSPRALPIRVKVDASNISSMTAELSFDTVSFGFEDSRYFDNPSDLTVYFRQTPGEGLFSPLSTNYNHVTKKLRATMTQFGEFIFCFDDLADVPYPPIVNEAENYRGVQGQWLVYPRKADPDMVCQVNQELPVFLSWSPKGFARSYSLQVAKDESFTNLVVDESSMTDAMYVLETVDPGTTYYWRVNTTNYGGTSSVNTTNYGGISLVNTTNYGGTNGWSVGSFATVPPMVEVTAPNGGEQWQRGLDFFIQWEDNIDEDVVLEVYKDNTFVKTIGTVTSDRAYEWEVDLALEPGCDYSIKVKSSEDEALFDMSDATFAIDPPDTTPPEFELSVTPTMLWPPTHKMVLITPSWTVSDDTDESPDVSLVGIVANEGDDTIGDGHTSDDIHIGEDGSIYIRSERSGTGSSRIYTITYEAVDDCGNVAVSSATVSIPHDFRLLARIASRWLWSGAGRIPEDLSGDGAVNLADIAKFAENWTK